MTNRRQLLSAALAGTLGTLPPAIARALDIPAKVRTGTLQDVEHIVILMQENRSFDHYFGTLNGVQGFGDRFAIPVADVGARKGGTIFAQPRDGDPDTLIAPFPLDTAKDFRLMRVEGTPHSFKDAQDAWDHGRMGRWPDAKHNHAMGYFTRADLPFQYALAEAFTLCDAYFCSMHAGTNPNRLFHWTGKNGGAIDNGYDSLSADPAGHGGYDWTTYPERLSAAGVEWQVYQDMDDNFTDNPLAGFKTYRAAHKASSQRLMDLARRSIRTRDLDALKADVVAGKLPEVSWIVATAEGSEHPGPSSPAQGADYTARVLDALTANPDVWAKTVLLINFDENDGYFDHVPPPAPPSLDADGKPLGHSAIDTAGEYHVGDGKYNGRPYGLGPRVPMYVVSPWSRGGYVASEVFDHTSVIRFLETRFGVAEPNISAWRRAVCGDLTSCFDFATPNNQPFFQHLPVTKSLADKARSLGGRTTPRAPSLAAPVQAQGQRLRRATPYDLTADFAWEPVEVFPYLYLRNRSAERSAVFHLYDRLNLEQPPLRFTVAPGKAITTRGSTTCV
ncbi:phospholipase C, phosphocholine-specific [Asticcacaulis biprosthecium C19]|uniref:phospholipase C n=1 Tax=Asticcacaulis biprosthecium C19 TaxID=715226 RepID=F4QP63_9CAUL|nr:phospholipase C, phosphocholine-specific [Asticcacaulis biprosthecium]EGF91121.1 phospholipase C, phosphocholine-specific [Asticcacaulis biprosthecium C19]